MNQLSRTILVVDDSPEDRELYRRYLLRDREYTYQILEASLGYQGMQLWQQHHPDILLLDYCLPDLDGMAFLTHLQSLTPQRCLPVIMVTGQGNEAIAVQAMKAGAQDYLVKGQITLEGLHLAVNGAIAAVQLQTQLQQRIEREHVVAQITRQIHQSLNLDEILQTTVTEVRQFLHTNRVLIFRIEPDGTGTVVAESIGSEWRSLFSCTIHDPCFAENYRRSIPQAAVTYDAIDIKNSIERYRQGWVTAISDIQDGSIAPCHQELLDQFQVKANLVVPIVHDDQFWGLLIAHHCAAPRGWQPLEIELLQELATQVSIALRQAVLYQQAQRELTERKQVEVDLRQSEERHRTLFESMERANRVKDEFLAILSHELRSPLNPILGWAKLMQTRKLDPEQTAQALATIERNAKLQTQLIDDLLDVAKILRGKLNMEVAPVNLALVIDEAIDAVKASAIAKSICLQFQILQANSTSDGHHSTRTIQVLGDAVRLQQIVWNLLSNAIKFTPNYGQVKIQLSVVNQQSGLGIGQSAVPDNQFHLLNDQGRSPNLQRHFTNDAQIIVSDTGKGINPDFLPYIFESFRQEDTSTTRQYGGLGLGLAIVRHLVEAHGGTIAADSQGEGLGSTFTVRLPLLENTPEQHLYNERFEQEPDLQGIRVLTVDDEPDTCELLTVLLTQYGATVLTFASAMDALNSLASFQPHVLISDIGMPVMDGYALLQQIRALSPEQGGCIPAIALTAYAREDDQQQSIASGFQRHMSKPLDLKRLVQTIYDLVQQTSYNILPDHPVDALE